MTAPIRLTPEDRSASQALVDAYAESWTRINDAQLALAKNPLNARKKARLTELSEMVSREVVKLDATAQAYLQEKFPIVHTLAAMRGAKAVDPAALAYVQPNREAAQLLADGLKKQLLEATRNVDESTKKLVRKIGRDAGLKTAIDGKTAKQAATEMARILRESGIHAVTYANGTKVGLKAYTEMAVRTSTALALNQGALQGSADAGCKFWEIFDGTSCGWKNHKDPDRAHGKVVTREEALAYPIAHPNCRRAVGPRPDLGIDKTKKKPVPTVTQDQVAAQGGGSYNPGKLGGGSYNPGKMGGGAPGPQDRVAAAGARADAAKDRVVAAQTKAAKSVIQRQTAQLPTPADADKVYPDYLFELAKIDKRVKAKLPPGNLEPVLKRMRARLAADGFDPDTTSEYDLLAWMQKSAADEGLGENLAVGWSVLGKNNEKRVVRYLVDGGKMPDPIDLKIGTKASDVLPAYVKRDATSFREMTREGEFDELWGDPKLTPAQSASLRAYSRGSDRAINKALREGAGDGSRVNAIRAAMRPLPESVRVVRGVDIDAMGIKLPKDYNGNEIRDMASMQDYLRNLKGQTIEDRGFMSTSVDPKGAFSGDIKLEIDVPEGYRGAWVEPFSSSPGEQELLLDRGTRLEIYEVVFRTDGGGSSTIGRIATVRARVVHQDGAFDFTSRKALP